MEDDDVAHDGGRMIMLRMVMPRDEDDDVESAETELNDHGDVEVDDVGNGELQGDDVEDDGLADNDFEHDVGKLWKMMILCMMLTKTKKSMMLEMIVLGTRCPVRMLRRKWWKMMLRMLRSTGGKR